jgi:hypothetical protein
LKKKPFSMGFEILQSKYDCQQLILSGRIIQLGVVQSSTCIINDVGKFVNALPQHSSNGVIGRVTHDLERCTPARGPNDGCGRQNCLQGPKCLLAVFVKIERGLLHQQFAQGPGNFAEVLDKSPIKYCMAQKRANFFHRSWGPKVGYQIYLRLVYLYPPTRDYMPEHNSLLYHKMSLLPIEHQVLLFTPHQN